MTEAHNEIVTSFKIIDLARRLDVPLDRWQEAVIIRHGEIRYVQQEQARLCSLPEHEERPDAE